MRRLKMTGKVALLVAAVGTVLVGAACGSSPSPTDSRAVEVTLAVTPAATSTRVPTDAADPTPALTRTPTTEPTSTPMPTSVPPTPTLAPSHTPVPPTETPLPATATPAPPTEPPTVPPTVAPTEPPAPVGAILRIIGVDKKAEFVDIQNQGDQPQDLAGWTLVSEKGSQACSLGGVIGPGAVLRIWALASDAGQGGFNCGFGSNIWNNSESDPAVLYDAAGQEVSRR